MRRFLVLVMLMFGSAAICLADSTPRVLHSSPPTLVFDEINNGLATFAYPSTGMLVSISETGYSTCTATLIGCQTALTAAHCVCPEDSSGVSCAPSTANKFLLFQHSGVYGITGIVVNPNWAPSLALGRHDLAILRLATPVEGVQPSPLNTGSKPAAGTVVALVGFGSTPTAPPGIKRLGLAQLVSCADPDAVALCYNFENPLGSPGEDSTACPGDSGGPMFVGPAFNLAGVTSGGLGPGSSDCTAPVQGVYSDVFTDRSWVQGQAGADLGQSSCGGVPNAGSPLAPYAGASGVLNSGNTSDSFTLDVQPNTNILRVVLNAEGYLSNDFDLYAKFGTPATSSNFDCKSDLEGSLERCVINSPAAGTWHLLVDRFAGDGAYQVTATTYKSASGPCVRDADTACLQADRFEVNVTWQNNSGTGTAQVMSFGGQRTENTETAFYSFQSPTNFEIGVKVLNACVPFLGNKFWVFLSGLTDQGWTVTVRDTQTGAIKNYSNANGHLSTTFADTAAFACQ